MFGFHAGISGIPVIFFDLSPLTPIQLDADTLMFPAVNPAGACTVTVFVPCPEIIVNPSVPDQVYEDASLTGAIIYTPVESGQIVFGPTTEPGVLGSLLS